MSQANVALFKALDTANDTVEAESGDAGFLNDARLRQLLEYWRRKKAMRHYPARADIDPIDIPRLLPHILLVDVTYQPALRFHFRLVGTAVVELYGAEFTGRYLEEIDTGNFQNVIYSGYKSAIKTQAPFFQKGTARYRHRMDIRYERAILPLGLPGETVNMLMVGTFFHRPFPR